MFKTDSLYTFTMGQRIRLSGVCVYVRPAGGELHQVRVLHAEWEDGSVELNPRVELFYTNELSPVD